MQYSQHEHHNFLGASGAMVNDKAEFIEKTTVDAVVATDAGCLMNIGGCLNRKGTKVRIYKPGPEVPREAIAAGHTNVRAAGGLQ